MIAYSTQLGQANWYNKQGPWGLLMWNFSKCSARPRSALDRCILLATLAVKVVLGGYAFAQTASTGALTGVTFDPSGAVLPGVAIRLVNQDSGANRSASSDESGRFGFLLLPPGMYEIEASKTGSATFIAGAALQVSVTEVAHIELHLRLATVFESMKVSADLPMVQTNSGLGKVVHETAVNGLPLVTRNFAQIASLSPGVSTGVYNAGELGLGGTALSQIAKSNDGIYVHGARSYDNNFQLDGI